MLGFLNDLNYVNLIFLTKISFYFCVQVIAFLYTAMRSVDLGLRTALIVTPVSVLHNWRHEFMKWRPSELKPLRTFMVEDVPRFVFLSVCMIHSNNECRISRSYDVHI